MDSLDEIWQQILDIIAKEITPTAFNTWFSDCKAVDMADCKLVLHTSSDFKRNIIENRFGEMIRKALYDLFSCLNGAQRKLMSLRNILCHRYFCARHV